jgi:hypothetical protein
MPILLELLVVKSRGWREMPRIDACDCAAPERADIVADRGKSARKVVVTI